VDDRNDYSTEKTQRHEPLLIVLEAIVGPSNTLGASTKSGRAASGSDDASSRPRKTAEFIRFAKAATGGLEFLGKDELA